MTRADKEHEARTSRPVGRRVVSSLAVARGGGRGARRGGEGTRAAIDVAKGSGEWCATRVPGSRPDSASGHDGVARSRPATPAVVATDGPPAVPGHPAAGAREPPSDYWRIWYYLAEAAGLQVWLVNARDASSTCRRGKFPTGKTACGCASLNERGCCAARSCRRRHCGPAVADPHPVPRWPKTRPGTKRVEKILEDALLKISVVISDLSGKRAAVPGRPGRRRRSPAAAGRARRRPLKPPASSWPGALTGRFAEIHAFEIATHLRLIDTITTRSPAWTPDRACSWRPSPAWAGLYQLRADRRRPLTRCPSDGTPVLGLVERLDGSRGRRLQRPGHIASSTDMSVFPHPACRRVGSRLTSRTLQSGTHRPAGRAGKGNPYLRGALGMRDGRVPDRYPPRRAVPPDSQGAAASRKPSSRYPGSSARSSAILISRPAARFTDLGAVYYSALNPRRQTRSKIASSNGSTPHEGHPHPDRTRRHGRLNHINRT